MENQIEEITDEATATAEDVLAFFETLATTDEDEEILHELNFE